MKKSLITILAICGLLNADTTPNIDYGLAPAPIYNVIAATQWDLFLKELEVNIQVHKCPGKTPEETAWGFNAKLIEPIGYLETTKHRLYFPFADFDLGNEYTNSMQGISQSRNLNKDGTARGSFSYHHFIYAPIMGMIMKKMSKFLCFSGGTIAFPMLTEFNPAYTIDVYFNKLIPQMMIMVSPQALVGGIFDCGATEATNAIRGEFAGTGDGYEANGDDGLFPAYDSIPKPTGPNSNGFTFKDKGLDGLNFLRNSMFFNVGCIGFSPVGGYVQGDDPGLDTVLLGHQSISMMHGMTALTQVPLLFKQTNFGMDTNINGNTYAIPDTMCAPAKFMLPIKSQYVMQRQFPTVGKGVEFGSSGLSTTASNLPASQDQYVYMVWERRDFTLFAYTCPNSGSGDSE